MRIRDKIITAACRTPDGIEWTSLNINQEADPVTQGEMPLSLPDEVSEDSISGLNLPESISEAITGDVTVALRSSELLMRTMQFPTADPSEIADMVEFQIDKVSPFPVDQLATAFEILSADATSALVLMAAAKRECIDAIGRVFEQRKVRIHSIDARVLGWLQLMNEKGRISDSGCEVLMIADGIDFVLTVLKDGKPLIFRSLQADLDEMTVVEELAYEISYTMTVLDGEHDLPAPGKIQFWTLAQNPVQLITRLSEQCKLEVQYHDLEELPPLSEGILRRTQNREAHIELIPAEWIEHQQTQAMKKKFALIASVATLIWLVISLSFFSVYKVREMRLQAVKKEADALAPLARQARRNQEKLKALKVYTDRSDSSLECLREVSRMMPSGDIEFIKYNYAKGKEISLRGTGHDKSIVTDFFLALDDSDLFGGIQNQTVNNQTTKGVKRAVFSVTLPLARKEEVAQ